MAATGEAVHTANLEASFESDRPTDDLGAPRGDGDGELKAEAVAVASRTEKHRVLGVEVVVEPIDGLVKPFEGLLGVADDPLLGSTARKVEVVLGLGEPRRLADLDRRVGNLDETTALDIELDLGQVRNRLLETAVPMMPVVTMRPMMPVVPVRPVMPVVPVVPVRPVMPVVPVRPVVPVVAVVAVVPVVPVTAAAAPEAGGGAGLGAFLGNLLNELFGHAGLLLVLTPKSGSLLHLLDQGHALLVDAEDALGHFHDGRTPRLGNVDDLVHVGPPAAAHLAGNILHLLDLVLHPANAFHRSFLHLVVEFFGSVPDLLRELGGLVDYVPLSLVSDVLKEASATAPPPPKTCLALDGDIVLGELELQRRCLFESGLDAPGLRGHHVAVHTVGGGRDQHVGIGGGEVLCRDGNEDKSRNKQSAEHHLPESN